LTGLYNRHHLNKTLHSQYLLARDSGSDLSLLVLDIDCFNEINTAFGQSFGDFVLNEMSARLTDSTRKEDLCFRRSGGDFVVLMPEVDLDGAKNTAEKIRQSCIGKPFCRKEMKREVTLSIGVASRKTHHPASADEFINMAETALFKAKADGRNRVYIYGPRGAAPSEIRQLDFESIKVRINRILEKTRHSAVSSIQLLARDVAGPGHREHIERVTNYTDLLGRQLGLPPAIIQTLQNAIILYTSIRHLIHNDLLSQRYRFSESDWKTLQDFPYKLSEIVEIFDYFAHERLILLTRSENYDGSGYPEGLKGAEIPLGARIISIVDSFAAMKADRPHRRRLEPDAILHELKTEAGKQFDPFLVLKLLDIIQRDNLLEVSDVDIAEFRAELLKKQSGSGL
jgi:diguanylate cyclase (GGDEF)-like protein